MPQSLNLAWLFIWPQNERWIKEGRFKLFKEGGGKMIKDHSQGIVLKMKETSKNEALLAQATFVHNSLRQSKAWTLVSARQLDKHSANTRRRSARAAQPESQQLVVKELQQGWKQQHCAGGCGRD